MTRKILEAVEVPIPHGSGPISISASIGVARFPEDGVDAEALLSHADQAMYRRKAMGRQASSEVPGGPEGNR